jgi:hypothetical protein
MTDEGLMPSNEISAKAGPGHYIGSHMAGPIDGLADIAMLIPDVDDD